MILSQMHFVFLCLVVISCCSFAEVEDDFVELVRAKTDGFVDRQFINSIKKWFTRSANTETKKTRTTENTKIKYLPVYVPFPVQIPIKMPSENEYYGAYQDPNKKKDNYDIPYHGRPTMPSSHVQEYELPFSGQLPSYLKKTEYGPIFTPLNINFPISYPNDLQSVNPNSNYGYDGMFNSAETEDDDSEIVENSELQKDLQHSVKRSDHVRKVNRKTHKPRPT